MASRVEKTNIFLTRGDTLYLHVTLKKQDGTEYEMQEGDKLRFALKRTYSDAEPRLTKQIIPVVDEATQETNLTLKIEPEDTKTMSLNSNWVYDIELTKANGDIATVVLGNFTVTEEVH